MHYTLQPARALIARRITISFFLVVSKQSGGRHALPVQSSPRARLHPGREQATSCHIHLDYCIKLEVIWL